jgi:O-antigen ligase
VLAVVSGGSTRTGIWANGIIELLSLPIILYIFLGNGLRAAPRSVLAFIAALFILPLLQLIPLPPAIWTLLPGRTPIAEAYRETGLALPFLPISLDPRATWLALLSLLPPVAMLLATINLDHRARRTVTVVLIAMGFVSAALGIGQMALGADSGLYIYPPRTLTLDSTAFFGNRNHYAGLLYGLTPFLVAWVVGLLFDHRPERFLGLAICAVLYVVLLLGLSFAHSRAGTSLAVAAALASLLLVANNESRFAKRGLLVVGGATVLAVALIVQFSYFALAGRLDTDLLSDFRFQMAETTIAAAKAFQPFGSGFGTFVPVYKMFETHEGLRTAYANHAHNDWLELWLEGGWLALAIAPAFLAWFGRATLAVWRAPLRGGHVLDRGLAQAASITIVLYLIHALVDFGLRTTTLMVVFAFCIGMLIPPMVRAADPSRASGETPRQRGSDAFARRSTQAARW